MKPRDFLYGCDAMYATDLPKGEDLGEICVGDFFRLISKLVKYDQ